MKDMLRKAFKVKIPQGIVGRTKRIPMVKVNMAEKKDGLQAGHGTSESHVKLGLESRFAKGCSAGDGKARKDQHKQSKWVS